MPSARVLRYLLIGLCACLLGWACVVIVLAPARIEEALRQADRYSRAATGEPLSFGRKPSLTLLPFAISFTDLHWGDEDSACTLTCRSGLALLNVSWLWGAAARVSEVRLDGPLIVYRASRGPQALAQGRAGADRRGLQAGDLSALLTLERITVSGGGVEAVTDGGDGLRLTGLNLSARGPAEAVEFEGDCVAALQSVSGGLSEATLALRGTGTLGADSLETRLQATLTPLRGLYPGHLGPASLLLDGRVDRGLAWVLDRCELTLPRGRAALRGRGGLAPLSFDGSLDLEVQTSRMDLPFPLRGLPDVRLRGDAAVADGLLTMPAFELASEAGRGRGALSLSPGRRLLTARLHCQDLELGRRPQAGMSAARETAARRQNREEGRPGTRLALDFSAGRLRLAGVEFTDVRASLAGTDRGVDVAPLHARIDGGLVEGRLRLLPDARILSSEGRAVNVPASAVAALAGYGGTPAVRLDAVWQVAAGAGGQDGGAAKGTGSVTLRGLSPEPLRRALGGASKSAADLAGEGWDAEVRFSVHDGSLSWQAQLPALNGRGDGKMNLSSGQVRGRLNLPAGRQRVDIALTGPVTSPSARGRGVHPAGNGTPRGRRLP